MHTFHTLAGDKIEIEEKYRLHTIQIHFAVLIALRDIGYQDTTINDFYIWDKTIIFVSARTLQLVYGEDTKTVHIASSCFMVLQHKFALLFGFVHLLERNTDAEWIVRNPAGEKLNFFLGTQKLSGSVDLEEQGVKQDSVVTVVGE